MTSCYLAYVLTFSDGGPPETVVLHQGTREECEHLRSLLPAVAYSGARPLEGAFTVLAPWPDADAERVAS